MMAEIYIHKADKEHDPSWIELTYMSEDSSRYSFCSIFKNYNSILNN